MACPAGLPLPLLEWVSWASPWNEYIHERKKQSKGEKKTGGGGLEEGRRKRMPVQWHVVGEKKRLEYDPQSLPR